MELKVGDYVRLDRRQGINRIDEVDEIGTFYLEDVIGDEWGDKTFRLDINDVIKSSPNIIDLIEEGDYVNGKKVIKVWEEPFGEFAGQIFTILEGEETAPTIRTIKSIVTKEQFENMEYEVK